MDKKKTFLLQKELSLFTYGDLLQHYPLRYEDRRKIHAISELNPSMGYVQVRGKILSFSLVGALYKKRLMARFSDNTGSLNLVWFQGVNWISRSLKPGIDYILYGKLARYGGQICIVHPEIQVVSSKAESNLYLHSIYPLTEKLRSTRCDNRFFIRLFRDLVPRSLPHLVETLPKTLIQGYQLISKKEGLKRIHFPRSIQDVEAARYRLKFEEFFFIQLRLIMIKLEREKRLPGFVFRDASLVTTFYNKKLPFALTKAQKRVIKEIYADLRSGKQMNRLLQGDVGCGKTIVGFICMLFVIGGKNQVALMAPTEILAMQHYARLKTYAESLNISIGILTGSIKKKDRDALLTRLKNGEVDILVGTHALLEKSVSFKQLGLAIIDEQHRFGVAQRLQLWEKNQEIKPHILIMTATPIPRTLALTLYGDLDVSVIDELPSERKPIKTIHRSDRHRLQVNAFIQKQVDKGSQVYIVYPLIQESEKLDYKYLMDGYESICRAFPQVPLSIVHGQMKADAKEFEMSRFVKGDSKIMVSTSVIEVGIDVANASVIVIESAERFGLSQLHQLRGRVGRGSVSSYCILMTGNKLSQDALLRMKTICQTNNGFDIAEADLKIRGYGDMMGTQQSGTPDLLIGNLSVDGPLLQMARKAVNEILSDDPLLEKKENRCIKQHVDWVNQNTIHWGRIS